MLRVDKLEIPICRSFEVGAYYHFFLLDKEQQICPACFHLFDKSKVVAHDWKEEYPELKKLESKTIKCTFCNRKSGNEAAKFCAECNEFLCSSCVDVRELLFTIYGIITVLILDVLHRILYCKNNIRIAA